ncbi:unnamed protein product, partial [Mesorhabditis belari]|uniref:Uncharacterized protein n=1 Tax=Mesorhabditis belari TaxID=2138241 RepID=A0AAF3J1D7_9BILA
MKAEQSAPFLSVAPFELPLCAPGVRSIGLLPLFTSPKRSRCNNLHESISCRLSAARVSSQGKPGKKNKTRFVSLKVRYADLGRAKRMNASVGLDNALGFPAGFRLQASIGLRSLELRKLPIEPCERLICFLRENSPCICVYFYPKLSRWPKPLTGLRRVSVTPGLAGVIAEDSRSLLAETRRAANTQGLIGKGTKKIQKIRKSENNEKC